MRKLLRNETEKLKSIKNVSNRDTKIISINMIGLWCKKNTKKCKHKLKRLKLNRKIALLNQK